MNSPLKLGFFSEPPKVTKFSLKLSQFEFLVMTRQSALVYKLVLSLNIRDFSLFFVKKLRPPPPEKSHLLFPSNPPLKAEVQSSHPLFEKLVGGSTPPAERGMLTMRNSPKKEQKQPRENNIAGMYKC